MRHTALSAHIVVLVGIGWMGPRDLVYRVAASIEPHQQWDGREDAGHVFFKSRANFYETANQPGRPLNRWRQLGDRRKMYVMRQLLPRFKRPVVKE
jgi:hypothetical protein